MILALEYMLRKKKVLDHLETPSSLFLEGKNKRVLNFYNQDPVRICCYDLSLAVRNRRLPPNKEFFLERSQLFCSDNIVNKDYQPIKFKEEDRNYLDLKISPIIETYLNPLSHQNFRADWLWLAFEEVYVDEDLRREMGVERDHKTACFFPQAIWRKWILWKRTFLDFSNYVSNELIFSCAYGLPIV